MREIVFDTETTGFDPATGDRIVEIGAVEVVNYLPTDRTFHSYINPQRDVPAEVVKIHGLTQDFLKNHPVFGDVADAFLAFIGDSPLVAHNAGFDWKFLNAELRSCGRPEIAWARIIDTHALAKQKLPGATASLDALCQRFGIDNSGRDLHGALLDSHLLAEVYLELVGGRQTAISFEIAETEAAAAGPAQLRARRQRPAPLPLRLSPAEAEAHAAFVALLGDAALWRRFTA